MHERSVTLDLSLHGVMLAMALLHLCNKRAGLDSESGTYRWNEDFVAISVNEISLYAKMDKRAIERARNELKQKGFIDFIPGDRRKNAQYKYLFTSIRCEYVPNNEPNQPFRYNNVPNNAPKTSPNCPQTVPKDVPIYINNNIYRDSEGTGSIYYDCYTEEYTGALMCANDKAASLTRRERPDTAAEERIKRSAMIWIEFTPEAGVFLEHKGTIERLLNCEEYPAELVTEAMGIAAKRNAASRVRDIIAYLFAVLDDWNRCGYRTRDDLREGGIL